MADANTILEFEISVQHGLQCIGSYKHGMVMMFLSDEPEEVEYQVRDMNQKVVGKVVLQLAMRKVLTALASPQAGETVPEEGPAVPAIPEEVPAVAGLPSNTAKECQSRAAELEHIFRTATFTPESTAGVSLRKLQLSPAVLGKHDPTQFLYYLQVSRVKNSGIAPLKTIFQFAKPLPHRCRSTARGMTGLQMPS